MALRKSMDRKHAFPTIPEVGKFCFDYKPVPLDQVGVFSVICVRKVIHKCMHTGSLR